MGIDHGRLGEFKALVILFSFFVEFLRACKLRRRIALYGTYANWAGTLLSAVLGTSRLTPIAGTGYSAPVWQEVVIGFALISLSIAMVICCVLVLWGLHKPSIG